MAAISKNYYGLSIYGPQDLRAAIWTSEIISTRKPINKLNMNFIGRRYEVGIESLDHEKISSSGFVDGYAEGPFAIIFEGCFSRFFYGWFNYETDDIPCTFELYKLTSSGYELIESNIQYASYFEKGAYGEEEISNIAYYKVVVSGIATPENKVSFASIYYSSSAIYTSFKTIEGSEWHGFRDTNPVRFLGPYTEDEENPLHSYQDAIETNTLEVEPTTIYQARILLLSADETSPSIRDLEITADFVEPEKEEDKIGNLLVSLQIPNSTLTSIDAVKVFSNNDTSLIESENVTVISKTTENWGFVYMSAKDIWSVPYTKSPERIRLIDRGPGDPPINGAVYGCIISEELSDTDVIKYRGIKITSAITEYVPIGTPMSYYGYAITYPRTSYFGTNRAPRIFIEAIQSDSFVGEEIPTSSFDQLIQLNGPVYGRMEVKNTQIITGEIIEEFIRNYKNSSSLSFSSLPVPIRIKISFIFYPSVSSSPCLDRLNCFSDMLFSRNKSLSGPTDLLIAYTSHVQSCQYTKNEHGRWWILQEGDLPVGLDKDESYLYITAKDDEPMSFSTTTTTTLESLSLDNPFPASLEEYLNENPTEYVPFKIINRNKDTSKYIEYRWAIYASVIETMDVDFSSSKNIMNVRDITFSGTPKGAIVVKNTISEENPLIKKYFSGVLTAENDSIKTSRIIQGNYVSYVMDGITPESIEEWEEHNVGVDSSLWDYPGWQQYAGETTTRLKRNLTSFDIYNAGPRPGDLILWNSEQKIYNGLLNYGNNKVDFEIVLEDETLPTLDEEVFTFIEENEIPYRVELVPGSVTVGNKVLDDDVIEDFLVSVPGEVIYGKKNYLLRSGALKIRRGETLEDPLIKESIQSITNVYYNDDGSVTDYIEGSDYSIIGTTEKTIVWSATPINTPPPEDAYYYANITYLELRRLRVQTSSNFYYEDNIVEYFRTPLETFHGECSRTTPYVSGVFDIEDFTIPEEGVDLNSLKLVVFDNSEYIKTKIENNRVIGEFEIKDINESWKPLIKNGAYFTNRHQDFFYNNKVSRVFNEDTVPILTENVFEEDALILQPGTENKIINPEFRRSDSLYSLINGITYFEEIDSFQLYKPFYIKRNEYLELEAVTDGTTKSGLVFYYTPSSHTLFYLEDGVGILETNRNGRLSLPIRRKEVSPAVSYTLKVILEETNIKCYINDYMLFNIEQGTYLEGFSGYFGVCTDFDIRIKGIESWNIQSYGNNPIYPIGNKIYFNNLYYTSGSQSYLEQDLPCYYDGTIVIAADNLEISLDDSVAFPSPLIVNDVFEEINIKLYNPTEEKISLEEIQIEKEIQTSYTPRSREDAILTIPYKLEEVNIEIDTDVLTNDCFILSLGNFELYKVGGFLKAKIGALEETSTTPFVERGIISISQDAENINILLNGEVACSIDLTSFILDDLLYFGNYLTYNGIIKLYSIAIDNYKYEFLDNLIFNDIDTIGITANTPGTPISVTCNGVKYKRTFYLDSGNYVLNNSITKKYDGLSIFDLDFKREELLKINAYLENGRALTVSSVDNGKIKINGLMASDIGVNIIINYIPKDTYTLNYNEENDNYILNLSNVYGTDILVVYEDVIGEEREIIENIELNPFKATLNNGFIFLAEQMPEAVSFEYKITPSFIYKNGRKDCLIILDVKAAGGTHTDNCLLTINGHSIEETIKTTYGEITKITSGDRIDQETSGRFFFKYTLLSTGISGILKETISIVDSIGQIGIEIPITIVG